MGNCLQQISEWCECEKGDENSDQEEENNNKDIKSKHSKATATHSNQYELKKGIARQQSHFKNQQAVKQIQLQHPSSSQLNTGSTIQARRIKQISQVSEREDSSLNTTTGIQNINSSGIGSYTINNNNNVTMLNNQTTIIQEEEEQIDSDHILSGAHQKQISKLQRCNTANNINPKLKMQSENIKQLLQRCKTGNLDTNLILHNLTQNNRIVNQDNQQNNILDQQDHILDQHNHIQNEGNNIYKDINHIENDYKDIHKEEMNKNEKDCEDSIQQEGLKGDKLQLLNMLEDLSQNQRIQDTKSNNAEVQLSQQLKSCKQTIGQLLKLRYELLQKKKANLEQKEVIIDSILDDKIQSNNKAISHQQKYFQLLLSKKEQLEQAKRLQSVQDQGAVKEERANQFIKFSEQINQQNILNKNVNTIHDKEDYQNQYNSINVINEQEQSDNQSKICSQMPLTQYINQFTKEQTLKPFLRQRNDIASTIKIQQAINTIQLDSPNQQQDQTHCKIYVKSKTIGHKQNQDSKLAKETQSNFSLSQFPSSSQKNNFLSKQNSIQDQNALIKRGKSIKNGQKLDTLIIISDEDDDK